MTDSRVERIGRVPLTSSARRAAKLLDDVADYIVEHGWCRGAARAPDGRVCIIGGMNACSRGFPKYRKVAELSLSHAIERRVRKPSDIVSWNDSPRRTEDQVVRLLRKTAEDLRTQVF